MHQGPIRVLVLMAFLLLGCGACRIHWSHGLRILAWRLRDSIPVTPVAGFSENRTLHEVQKLHELLCCLKARTVWSYTYR